MMKKNNIIQFPANFKEKKIFEDLQDKISDELMVMIRNATTSYILDETDMEINEENYLMIENLIMVGVAIGIQYSIERMTGVYDEEE